MVWQFSLPEEEAGEEILARLEARFGERFGLRRHASGSSGLTFYDTFDWRLHRDGGLLAVRAEAGGRVLAWDDLDGCPRRHQVLEGPLPGFVRELPPGPFRAALAPVVAMRRLLPVVDVERTSTLVELVDGEGKTLARLRLDADRVLEPGAADGGRALPPVLRLLPLRGYDRPAESLRSFLADELGLTPLVGDELGLALAALGGKPRGYSSKVEVDLDPEARADAATFAVLRSLLATLRVNEEGVRRDLDSEFLHDFRVAVRRSRSALGQVKDVLSPAAIAPFKAELAWLGAVTGPTRDLDVYLLKLDDYQAALPAEVRPHLEPLRDFLREEQAREHERLVAVLGSDRYRELIATLGAFLAAEPPPGPAGGRPIRELAAERIWRAYRKVLKRGREIGDDTPAAALHRLRIDAKKLRYLLELFRVLFPAAAVEPRIRALKKLQDNLGDFNDLEVQRHQLRDLARRMEAEGRAPAATLLALGELVAGLRRRQDEERRHFHERFAAFATRANRQAFRRLFRPAGAAA